MSSKDWWVFPGFEIELKAEGLNLPVNLAFNPNKENKALFICNRTVWSN